MYEFKLPDLGEGVAEGEILKWYVEVGGNVTEDEPLVDIETDKAAVTIPSPKSGKLESVAGKVGDTVAVGTILVKIDDGASGDAEAPAKTDAKKSAEPAEESTSKKAEKAEKAEKTSASSGGADTNGAPPLPKASPPSAAAVAERRKTTSDRRGGPVPAAPATRRLARELGLDINAVPGSGPAGRVTPDDVRLFAEGGVAVGDMPDTGGGTAVSVGAPTGIPYYQLESTPDFEQWGEVEREPVRSIRKKVAHRMVTSMVTVPHVAHMDDADVTELEAYRTRVKAKTGRSITSLAFLVKAVTVALEAHPSFNASLDPERGELVYKKYTNIGFAADTPNGLMVPVIKGTDALSITEIAEKIVELATKARERSIDVADLQGGTFTITNVGAIGGSYVIPTINYPESAILGMGRTQDRAVVREGDIVARKILPLCITYDHRISDGADGARFMNKIVRYMSDPLALLSEM